jgi:competence protein ComEC
MATRTGEAPSTGFDTLQTALRIDVRQALARVEAWLEAERGQLALWLPVMLGVGIAGWFTVPIREGWVAIIAAGIALAAAGVVIGVHRRLGVAIVWAGLAIALGCGLVWAKASFVAAAPLSRPVVADFVGTVRAIEPQPAREQTRLVIIPAKTSGLPPIVRVNVRDDDWRSGIATGQSVRVRARLMPPPTASIPGGYDFARFAWFQGIGGVGKALGPISLVASARESAGGYRDRLAKHIATRLAGGEAGIATALATGDQGGVSEQDQDAMRASGLAHLLSISGLHVTAVVAAIMFVTLRLLALSEWLALRLSLPLVAAGAGALGGIGYTLVTGAQVPTIRSCVAALLILIGIAMGREAMTLRLVATGALAVLFIWPEALVGPSFQLSFAAITALVALHEVPTVQRWTLTHESSALGRVARNMLSLLLTGLVVEITLAPIALYHFHQSGVFGAIANIIAIPLTTFVIMPAEALALLLDSVGIGAPFWWIVAKALGLLLWMAREVSALPGSVARLPEIPVGAFALIVAGGLWTVLWRSRIRLVGAIPFIGGVVLSVMTSPPDVLVTGDGVHLAVRGDQGELAILRPRAGDYVRDTLAERSAYGEELEDVDYLSGANCSDDVCIITVMRGDRSWTIVATRSRHFLEWKDMARICSVADIVVSDRSIPKSCAPRWIKADRPMLEHTGGLAISFANKRVQTVRRVRDDHPWISVIPTQATYPQLYRRRSPAKRP